MTRGQSPAESELSCPLSSAAVLGGSAAAPALASVLYGVTSPSLRGAESCRLCLWPF